MAQDETNALLNLIKHQQPNVDKIYFTSKDPFESKYQLLVSRREKIEVKQKKNAKAFIDHSQVIDDVYEKTTIQQRKEKY